MAILIPILNSLIAFIRPVKLFANQDRAVELHRFRYLGPMKDIKIEQLV